MSEPQDTGDGPAMPPAEARAADASHSSPSVSTGGGIPIAKEPLEFRPDHDGAFDEIVARFADGMVHVETMSDNSCYVGFYWDDGRYCQWWISSKKKLRYSHEDGKSDPPRYSAQGVDRKPWMPDYAAQAIEARSGETREAGLDPKDESAVPNGDAPESHPEDHSHD